MTQAGGARLSMMSKEAIQAFLQQLEALPDSDQRLVLTFLANLRSRRSPVATSTSENGSALTTKDGLLIFTGQLEGADIDWVRLLREEHDEELLSASLPPTASA